ncbi:YchF/TatD family DNA exonuclease [Alginatibacterium sediminis]|uniref:YchF/TatD family DNA exonuclease n=1 Tax=Alginatibacterium sediminis TaxID=2164068 RepID=A0A420EHE2_9ALTE|nr:YchF/TatD family DNA exonuclease [Alginatibacterium sediminis]RKF20125.1 YchF/TatD family DNA exonuclease [Alginatibacterium sediminis]
MLVDSHCHLDRLSYNDIHIDLADVVNKAKLRKVEHFLSVCINLESFESMLELIAPFKEIFASCGVHPLYLKDSEADLDSLYHFCSNPKVVAVGETGLDYFYSPDNKDQQLAMFEQHIDVAVATKKPLIIHTRDAKEDTLRLLKHAGAERVGGVLHCFTGDLELAEQAMEMGFYISASGIVTFKNAKALQEVFTHIPVERILVETDSPYLAPIPHRGQENQPAYTADVADFMARLKGLSYTQLCQQTSDNFFELFKFAQR